LTIVLGALLDGIPESAVLGLTLLQTGSIGAAMLVAVFVSNLPEGVAATVGLRNSGWSTSRIVTLWSAIALASGAAAAAGFALLDTASPDTVAFVLSFAAGAVLTMLATSMIPEAYEHAGRSVGLVTVLGFIVPFAINWLEG
jgi:ZIP family zinc transporter